MTIFENNAIKLEKFISGCLGNNNDDGGGGDDDKNFLFVP